MKDLVDIFKEKTLTLCPECGSYDSNECEFFDTLDADNIDDVVTARQHGLSLCGVCRRYFS